ncbi:endonuclease/exonuclease/phosphatase family protein [Sphingosinicella sp. BN140058]|uniref:endonuclease/exonuclease/phosphatase family protein n=1 Tax=Sphingosinicella sp. BN140058 TaxID=1892855 RepID=UPI001012FCB5|nr:endonuclease/exonuclease/phosphatase family protein [Sphingosinicella sp. BN140058]QAY77541.1 endonuclease/exonuclease/phosphatase [Sphingosinicella sp. BN140058]
MVISISGRRLFGRKAILVLAILALSAAQLPPQPVEVQPAAASAPVGEPLGEDALSILTYNVNGLPWPVASGRDEALARIGSRLRRLRSMNRHPHIVLLQEAFTDSAKRIGRDAGYRHIVSGPPIEAPSSAGGLPPSEAAFLAAASPFKGEGVGKFADSGLQILSDYPILAVRRAAFPDQACAGFDCLANKGMVAVLVAIPGAATPVAIINTHLNARKASGVTPGRALEAYRRQWQALDRFRTTVVPPDVPVVVAGDFNVGKSPERRALAHLMVTRWLGSAGGVSSGGVLRACFEPGVRCGRGLPRDAVRALRHDKDWQVALANGGVALVPQAIEVPFGVEADGTMLSDHVGYAVRYQLERRSPRTS